MKVSALHFLLINFTNSSTYIINKRHDVDQIHLTPTIDVIIAQPYTLSVKLYIAINSASVTIPHPKRFKVMNILCRGITSEAFEKSINVTNNFLLFLLAESVSSRKVTICSKHPRVFCAPACSRLG